MTHKAVAADTVLYSLMTNNRGKKPSEHVDQTERKKKKFASYIVNKMYTSDWNITNDSTVSSVIPILGQ